MLITEQYVDSIRYRGFKAFKTQRIEAYYVEGPISIETLEGSEHLAVGEEAWLVTAFENKGEQYFIHPDNFWDLYDETSERHVYTRRPDKLVIAYEMDDSFEVKVSWLDALLQGNTGDFLIEYGPNDYNIVERETFFNSYIEVN